MKISFPITSITIHYELEHKKLYSWSQRKAAKLFKLKLDGPYYEFQFKIHTTGNPVQVGSIITVESFGVPLNVITATGNYIIVKTNHIMKFDSARLLMMARNGIIVYQTLGEDKSFVRAKY